MARPAVTVGVFGAYLFCLGIVLLVAPNVLLSLFGLPETTEVWIRVLGVVVINIGVYYWYAAKSEAKLFFRATVYARFFVLAAFTALVLLGMTKPVLILFGAVDAAGALWTLLALKADAMQAPA